MAGSEEEQNVRVNKIKELKTNKRERTMNDENLELWLNRKKELDEWLGGNKETEEWAFQRSKKVQISPKEKEEKEKREGKVEKNERGGIEREQDI